MAKPGTDRARVSAAASQALAWLDARIDYERTPPNQPAAAAFGLDRMRRLLRALGNPQDRLPVVHVAGTKGKGSTVAMLAAILEEAGLRTGRYMSPHVRTVAERISIDGAPIGRAELAKSLAVVRPAVEALDVAAARRGGRGPTWFEILTAAAFEHFVRSRVDIAVLETGLGGRLDATNVSRPLVSVITSISFDHMGLLGRTIGRIAGEKAGIIKRGCPVVSGAVQPAARRVIAETARRRRARLVQLGRDFLAGYEPPAGAAAPFTLGHVVVSAPAGATAAYRLGMAGRHQADNAALAVMAARELATRGVAVDEAAIARGLARARLPARLEILARRPLLVVDGAHNVASMEALAAAVDPDLARLTPRVLVFSASRDKQVEGMLAAVRGVFDEVVLTRYRINPRAADIDRLREACRAAGLPRPHVVEPPGEAVRLARRLAGAAGSVVVAGSFFLAGEIGSD
ncbi:MAG: bifunctional folylpolyglutamate synthase/dihydrofolate synthase [Planctomycetota bacterium]